MILAGDLGGTKSNLGLFDVKAEQAGARREKRYATQRTFGPGRNHGGFSEWARRRR